MVADNFREAGTRPLIGITGSHDRATWNIWVDDVVLVPAAYTKAVERAGGQPVVIPPGDCDISLVEKLEGLVVAGGADLNPDTYGEAPVPETADWRDRQDASERGLVAAVLERDLPLLGICRGLQLLAVMHGGRLHQHLPGTAGHEEHGGTGGTWTNHEVSLEPGSRIASILGASVTGNSGHHQGVADAGTLRVTGRTLDGLIEAAEHPDRKFCIAVQWHPEMVRHDALFAALVTAAR